MRIKIIRQYDHPSTALFTHEELAKRFEMQVNTELEEIEKSGMVIDVREMVSAGRRTVMVLYDEKKREDEA